MERMSMWFYEREKPSESSVSIASDSLPDVPSVSITAGDSDEEAARA